MFTLAEALQQKNADGSVKVWGLNSTGWEHHSLLSIQRSLGVFWWDNEKKQFNLDNDEMAQAFDLLCAKPIAMGIEGILGMSQIDAFVAGTVALARGNFSSAGEGWKVGIQGENVIAPSPVKGKPPLFVGEGGWGFEIPKGAKNEAAAVEFMKFVCTYEAQYIFSQIYGGGMPANNSVAQSDIYAGDHPVKVGLRRCVKALENCVYWGNEMGVGGQADTPFGEISASVREKKLTPKEAAKQLQDACTKLYQQWQSEA